MKPDPAKVLEVSLQTLVGEIAPAVSPKYRQSTVGMLAMLLQGTREELERAVARRVEENAAMRALFARGAALATDAALAAQLALAARGADPSLLVSALDAENRRLRALLVSLHAHVETLGGPDARALEADLWRELAASTERRRLSFAPF
jgi:hypothetical protein